MLFCGVDKILILFQLHLSAQVIIIYQAVGLHIGLIKNLCEYCIKLLWYVIIYGSSLLWVLSFSWARLVCYGPSCPEILSAGFSPHHLNWYPKTYSLMGWGGWV